MAEAWPLTDHHRLLSSFVVVISYLIVHVHGHLHFGFLESVPVLWCHMNYHCVVIITEPVDLMYQDCDELADWVAEKMLAAQDETYRDAKNAHSKWMRHQV